MRRAGGKQSQRALEQPRRRRRGDGARGRAADRGLRGRAATTVTTGPIPSFTSPPLVAHSIAMHNDECRRAGRFGDSCCAARHDARHDAWGRRDHGRDRLSANAACIAAAGGIIPLVALVSTRAPLSKERAASALWHSSRRRSRKAAVGNVRGALPSIGALPGTIPHTGLGSTGSCTIVRAHCANHSYQRASAPGRRIT